MSNQPESLPERPALQAGEVYLDGESMGVHVSQLRKHSSDIHRLLAHLPLIREFRSLSEPAVIDEWVSDRFSTDYEIRNFAESLREVGSYYDTHADGLRMYADRRRNGGAA